MSLQRAVKTRPEPVTQNDVVKTCNDVRPQKGRGTGQWYTSGPEARAFSTRSVVASTSEPDRTVHQAVHTLNFFKTEQHYSSSASRLFFRGFLPTQRGGDLAHAGGQPNYFYPSFTKRLAR
jgi:hypothetical protein